MRKTAVLGQHRNVKRMDTRKTVDDPIKPRRVDPYRRRNTESVFYTTIAWLSLWSACLSAELPVSGAPGTSLVLRWALVGLLLPARLWLALLPSPLSVEWLVWGWLRSESTLGIVLAGEVPLLFEVPFDSGTVSESGFCIFCSNDSGEGGLSCWGAEAAPLMAGSWGPCSLGCWSVGMPPFMWWAAGECGWCWRGACIGRWDGCGIYWGCWA